MGDGDEGSRDDETPSADQSKVVSEEELIVAATRRRLRMLLAGVGIRDPHW
jgi:hypothetical protein